jgi:tetratricopeptide (TPR) repeat protein
MRLMLGALAMGGLLAGCVLLAPPPPSGAVESTGGYDRAGPPAQAPGQSGAAPAAQPSPFGSSPAQPQQPPPPVQKQFAFGAAAAALVGEAHAQERSRNFGLAAQTLERALSIEPRNPLVWIELGRENILAGNAIQAYGMGRKALYLASGDPHAQARAWQLIAASLRAQGRNDEAYAAEERAVGLSPQ